VALRISLTVGSDAETERARRALEKSARSCIVTNFLRLPPQLTYDVALAETEPPAPGESRREATARPARTT
jgi:hypothetical protein